MGLAARYTPGAPPWESSTPGQIITVIWDELHRISLSMQEAAKPVAVSVRAAQNFPIGTTDYPYQHMLVNNPIVEWEQPGGTWNAGVWTAPQSGLYQFSITCSAMPFDQPGIRSYSLSAKLTVTGTAARDVLFYGGGMDDEALGLSGTVLVVLAKGDTVKLSAAARHANISGSVVGTAWLEAIRVSDVR